MHISFSVNKEGSLRRCAGNLFIVYKKMLVKVICHLVYYKNYVLHY